MSESIVVAAARSARNDEPDRLSILGRRTRAIQENAQASPIREGRTRGETCARTPRRCRGRKTPSAQCHRRDVREAVRSRSRWSSPPKTPGRSDCFLLRWNSASRCGSYTGNCTPVCSARSRAISGKVLPFDMHQEREDVARRLAPKAVVEAAIRVHVKGRGLFVVKRAQAPEAVAGLLERDVVADDVCDGGTFADFSNLVFGNHRRASVGFACFLASAARPCSCGAMAHAARASLRQSFCGCMRWYVWLSSR